MNEQLMEAVVSAENLDRALQAVIRNKGAAGIDKMTAAELAKHFAAHREAIVAKLVAGRWTPSPVKRVEIPKPGGGVRRLGIPTVMDRLIQQALLQVLGPIFEAGFSESSYGFRAGRSAQQAVRAAQGYVEAGKGWVVDIDIERFFDTLNQDVLMDRVARVIRDKRILRLIGRYLRAGVLVGAEWEPSPTGTPQGGPLSPLLGNIYLDPLDRELEGRGLSFCRYADDCNIYVASEAAAERVAASVSEWIERRLRLGVNRAKSGRGRPWERQFLGFAIDREGRIELAERSLERYKRKVRELWRGGQALTSRELRDRWRSWLEGWWGYFRLAENRERLLRLEGWTRRHIRKCFWLRWHDTAGRKNALRKLGVNERLLRVVATRRGSWFMARNAAVQQGLSNARLKRHGFLVPSQLAAW
jgi:group II intron reverse transcriptase/maturase